jgi:hypothetical protein
LRDELAFRSEREPGFHPKIADKNGFGGPTESAPQCKKRRSPAAREYSAAARKTRIGTGWTDKNSGKSRV